MIVAVIVLVLCSVYLNWTKGTDEEAAHGNVKGDGCLFVLAFVFNVVCLFILLVMTLIIPHAMISKLDPVSRYGSSALLALIGYAFFKSSWPRTSMMANAHQEDEGCLAGSFLLGISGWGIVQTILGTIAAIAYLAIFLAS